MVAIMGIPTNNKLTNAILAEHALQLREPDHCTRHTRSASSGTIVSVFYNSASCQARDLPTNLITRDFVTPYYKSAQILHDWLGSILKIHFQLDFGIMNMQRLLTVLILMLPALSWGTEATVPEPGVLPLLAAGGVVAIAVKFMKRKK